MSGKVFFKQVFVAILTAILSVLPLMWLVWLFGPDRFFKKFTAVFSGGLFTTSWNRIHAGFVLDQPTIGKWYFWFTIFTIVGLPYMAMVWRFFVRGSKVRHWIFIIGLTILCLFLVCLLTGPFWWLIQYIHAMGWTPKRFCGLLYGIGGYLVVLWFWFFALRLFCPFRAYCYSE